MGKKLLTIPVMTASVLSPSECAKLIDDATPSLRDNVRTTRAKYRTIAKFKEDTPETLKLKTYMAAAVGSSVDYIEPVEVVRYELGSAYREHTDLHWRLHTMLCYLNENYEGGETRFARNGVGDIKGRTGDCLLWPNSDGHRDFLHNAHSVQKITAGEKWVAVVWHWGEEPDLEVISGQEPKRQGRPGHVRRQSNQGRKHG